MRILLVDDDLRSLKGMESILTHVGNHECVIHQDPVDAIAAYKESPFDVVITDINMPHLSGVDLLKNIRESDKHAVVIMVTGYGNLSTAIDSVNHHATAYLTKPIDLHQLLSTLKTVEDQLQESLKEQELLKDIEMKLDSSGKVELLGKAACGLMHDFNNILAVIIGQLDLLMLDNLGANAALQSKLEVIHDSAMRASKITKNYLSTCKKQHVDDVQVQLNAFIEDYKSFLSQVLGSRAHLEISLDPTAGSVELDVSTLEQILLNLTVNARDAIEPGQNGMVRIETRMVRFDNPEKVNVFELEPGNYVSLTFEDNGVGMTEEVQNKAFQPFFTTKSESDGTGIGLYTVYNHVVKLSGAINLQSGPGKGSTFQIFLPIGPRNENNLQEKNLAS